MNTVPSITSLLRGISLSGCLLVSLLLLIPTRNAAAQAAWEFSPYRVKIWVALPDDPTWQESGLEPLRAILLGRAETTFGPLWSTEVEAAPLSLAGEIRHHLADVTIEQVQAAVNGSAVKSNDVKASDVKAEEVKTEVPPKAAPPAVGSTPTPTPKPPATDKIYLVGVNEQDGQLRIQIREVDYRARQLGIVLERQTQLRDALPWQIWDGIAAAFTPLALIERVDGNQIAARIRAGGLITTENSAAWIKTGSVLRPILRRNDRAGEPMPNRIALVNWTMLEVLEQTGSQLQCKLHTGYRSPIPAKSTSRSERLALLVRPQFPATRLHLRTRDAQATPLVGYEVWRKNDAAGELLGSTNWRGDIELPKAETGALQTLLVKSGGQLLARLPIVPGQEPLMEAVVVNDDGRLQAEGLVQAFQSRIMDLEARRQISAARIRSRIKDNKLEEAEKLLNEFRELETRADLNRFLDQQTIRSPEGTTQKRIDKMIFDARTLLGKFLDPELNNILNRELQVAKTAKPAPAPTTKPATPPVPVPVPMPVPAPMGTTPPAK